MPRSADRNAAAYPPGPEPSTSISQSMSAPPPYAAAAGTATGAAGGAAAGAAPATPVVSVSRRPPSLTLSPTFAFTSLTVPAAGDGMSIVALSDSSVTSGSSGLTLSPGLTSTSMIGTSSKSPMSGTSTSWIAPMVGCRGAEALAPAGQRARSPRVAPPLPSDGYGIGL